MNFLDIDYNPVTYEDISGLSEKYIWYYSTEFKDFYVSNIFPWVNPKSLGYVIEVEGHTTVVPEHFFAVVCDYDIGLDSIQFAEIIGREFDVFTMDRNLEEDSWLAKPMKVVGIEEDYSFYYPLSSNMFPIVIGERVIVVASKDMYNKVRRLSFSDFV